MRIRSTVFAGTLLAALALVGCADTNSPERVRSVPAMSHNWASGALVQTSTPSAGNSVSAIVGPTGGVIRNGAHALSLPPMAVAEPTEITFTMVGGTYILADLSARRVRDQAAVTTFAHPITLTLSFRDAVVGDPHRLRITYLVDGTTTGRRQPQPSHVSPPTKTVSALLTHFSIYSMEIN